MFPESVQLTTLSSSGKPAFCFVQCGDYKQAEGALQDVRGALQDRGRVLTADMDDEMNGLMGKQNSMNDGLRYHPWILRDLPFSMRRTSGYASSNPDHRPQVQLISRLYQKIRLCRRCVFLSIVKNRFLHTYKSTCMLVDSIAYDFRSTYI